MHVYICTYMYVYMYVRIGSISIRVCTFVCAAGPMASR